VCHELSAEFLTQGHETRLERPGPVTAPTVEPTSTARPGTPGPRPIIQRRAGTIHGVTERPAAGLRRSWPQRLLILLGLVFSVGMLAAAVRLASFEDAVASIVRIEVPAGVLADVYEPDLAADDDLDGGDRSVDDGDDRVDKPLPPRNFLLIGTDSAVGLDADDPAGHRDRTPGVALADAIMLLRLDPGLSRASLVSLPRDLYVMIHRNGIPVREEKLASALLVGGMELGAPTLVETVTNEFGVPIHNFVIIDFLGFENIVDEIGGVSLWSPYPARDLASGLYVSESGCTLFDGRAALSFVRSRKPELFIDGNWQRVGVWNDLERNRRQQDFLVLAMERVIANGARSVIVRDDLIEAIAGATILDDRLILRDLLDLGTAFADFDPTGLERHSLPVYDEVVRNSSVLRLHPDARKVFDVFRGITLRPDDVPLDVIDRRGPVDESVPAFQQMVYKGFPVRPLIGEAVPATTIRASRYRFDAAVLVGQMVAPMPRFEFDDALDDRVELILGEDFGSFLLAPRDLDQVKAVAQAALGDPADMASYEDKAAMASYEGLGVLSDLRALPVFDPALALITAGDPSTSPVPFRATRGTLRIKATTFDGRRPDGSRCS
jgi:LCP family protein required for cell wall assembly